MVQKLLQKSLFLLASVYCCGTSTRFDPFTGQDLFAETLDCFVNLDISPGRIRQYQAGVFPDDPDTWCLVRCVAVKLGLYRDRYGPNVAGLYEQFRSDGVIGGELSEVRFKQAAYGCLATQLDRPFGGACERAYRMMIGCFGGQIRKLIQFREVANRTDPCRDCYRMFDELYRSTMVEGKTDGKCSLKQPRRKPNHPK